MVEESDALRRLTACGRGGMSCMSRHGVAGVFTLHPERSGRRERTSRTGELDVLLRMHWMLTMGADLGRRPSPEVPTGGFRGRIEELANW